MEAMVQRELAEDLRSAVTLCRVAEAGLLSSLCEFAEAYRVDAEDLLEVLAERRIQIGGEGTPRVSEYLMLELAGLLRCTPAAAGHRVVEALNLKHRHPGLFAAVRRCQIDADRALRAAVRCGALSQAAAEAGDPGVVPPPGRPRLDRVVQPPGQARQGGRPGGGG